MKKIFFLAFVFLFGTKISVHAQTDTPKHKIAIFAPLYLDSALTMQESTGMQKMYFRSSLIPGLNFMKAPSWPWIPLPKKRTRLKYMFMTPVR